MMELLLPFIGNEKKKDILQSIWESEQVSLLPEYT